MDTRWLEFSRSVIEFSANNTVREFFANPSLPDMTPLEYPYAYAIAFGLILGAAELMARYRDEPFGIFKSKAALLYIALNGLLSAISLYLIGVLGLSFSPESADSAQQMVDGFRTAASEIASKASDDTEIKAMLAKALEDVRQFLTPQTTASAQIYNILMAGFGGAAFFRSSVMRTKIGEKEVSVGPGLVIDTLLGALDREVDRVRAVYRSQAVEKLMPWITLRDAAEVIVPYCIELMQNLKSEERVKIRDKLEEALKDIVTQDKDDPIKPVTLCLNVVEFVGFDVLGSAIKSLRSLSALDTVDEAKRKAEVRASKQASVLDKIDAIEGRLRGAGDSGIGDTISGAAAEDDATLNPAPQDTVEIAAGDSANATPSDTVTAASDETTSEKTGETVTANGDTDTIGGDTAGQDSVTAGSPSRDPGAT